MIKSPYLLSIILSLILLVGCNEANPTKETLSPKEMTAAELLGNPKYPGISFGGHRHKERSISPTKEELKEDMKILSAMDIRFIRTYNTQLFEETGRLLEAIRELKKEDAAFEMYVMLGIWMSCEASFTEAPNHEVEDFNKNTAEMEMAIDMAKNYPDIIKVMAVGNESMVNWAAAYYVQPTVILKYVNQLQALKKEGIISKDMWITSSDNHSAWGGEVEYQTEELTALINAVDYLSVHTYPFHDTHYHPEFWFVPENENDLPNIEKVDGGMLRAKESAKRQYQTVADYLSSIGVDKPIHIGETGWASMSNGNYGDSGTNAADEYKEKLFYDHMRDWTTGANMSCFLFEAFDEPWKDANNEAGSENHFGLFTVDGEAKYVVWDWVDLGVFKGLTRNGNPITKSYEGNAEALLKEVLPPTAANDTIH